MSHDNIRMFETKSDRESSNFKQLLDELFCDIQNNQGRGKGYQPKLKAEADNPYRDLDYCIICSYDVTSADFDNSL